jgi:2-methylcitrate dehydratase PrpD
MHAITQPQTHHPQPLAAALARFALDLRYSDIPAQVRDRAQSLILDAVGIAIAANHYPFSSQIMTALSKLGGPGECSVIGRSEQLPLRDAVTMNGALIHGLDYDDTHMNAIIHATAATLPALIGMAEQVDASGEEILTAYAVGMEVAIRLGLVQPFGWHHEGFHATGVVAHFAAALTAGRLLGLCESQLVCAQGIVGSTASASQEFAEEGAWNKRLHTGWGGVAGITAAYLAQSGFAGPSKPYEGRYGVFRMHMGENAERDFSPLTDSLGTHWELAASAIKPYPTCHFTHAATDAALVLRKQHQLRPDDIASVRVLIPQDTLPVVAEPAENKRQPRSDYDGKFSMHYITAAALTRGYFGLAELEAEALGDDDILQLARRIECEADPDSRFPEFFSGGVEITTRDGQLLRHHEPVNRGAGDRALSHAEIEAKFVANTSMLLSCNDMEQARDHIMALTQLSGRQFMAGLRM